MSLAKRLAVAALIGSLGCAGQPDAAPEEQEADLRQNVQFGDPLPGLSAADKARFTAGQAAFAEVETMADGLGPVFNEASCAACHIGPSMSVGGSNGRLETRFGLSAAGRFDPLSALGGSLLQDHGIGAVGSNGYVYAAEQVPAAANVVARRRTTPLFGLGLIDAVPEAEIQKLAALERAVDAAAAGTVAMVPDISRGRLAVGRFGWKNQNPTLFQFSGDAYLNEMGITNPEFPSESCPQGDCTTLDNNPVAGLNDDGEDVVKFTDFMSLLAPPPRGHIGTKELTGELVFVAIGCATCHTPTLVTGRNPVSALHLKAFHPFSDFLLHDMGSLGDGIEQGPAGTRQMRTQPLWGLRTQATLLHDGRATTPAQAILAHDGQGKRARDRFATLRSGERAVLLAFLASL
jgi:CxxC motif-containing protein (DUF1111 family)